jgi:hypothetical protein
MLMRKVHGLHVLALGAGRALEGARSSSPVQWSTPFQDLPAAWASTTARSVIRSNTIVVMNGSLPGSRPAVGDCCDRWLAIIGSAWYPALEWSWLPS